MDRLDAGDPQRIGPYTLLGRLGAGGMGAVYLGRSSGGRTVAVKVVRPELAGDTAFRDRFRAEVSAARAVAGAFTAPVVDADPEAEMPWMATAFVAGVPLSQAIATRGPLPEASLWMFAAGVAEALADIHRAKLIHRDLKPGNVLLAPDGPHVIDFGITRAMEGAARITAVGSIVGSPGYMSPEQVFGQPLGPESDMFSLGATLVYAATGRSAYGVGPTPVLMSRVANGEPDPAALAAVPALLREVAAACLHRDPALRPTPRQLVDYVEAHRPVAVGGSGGSWLPPALTADVVAAGAVVTGDSPPFGLAGVGVGSVSGNGSGVSGPVYGTTIGSGVVSTPQHSHGMSGTAAGSHDGGGHGGGFGGGPGRRNLLFAAGGAVVLLGAGAGIIAMTDDGSSTSNQPAQKTPTSPTSPTNPTPGSSTPTTSTPSGAAGIMAGPTAKPAWTATLSEESKGLQRSGNVLVNLGDASIGGYDAGTGNSKWAKPVPISSGKMLVAGGTVYASGDWLTDTGDVSGLFAIDAAAGTQNWIVAITDHSAPSSISGVLNDVVFVEGADAAGTPWLWAVDGKTRKQLWRQSTKANGSVCVPASGGKIFVGTVTDRNAGLGQVQMWDAATGAKGWTLSVKNGTVFQPDSAAIVAGSGGLVYIADQVYAIDPATDKQKWAWTPPGMDAPADWPSISSDGGLVVVCGASTVYAVDANTGQQKWKTALYDPQQQLSGSQSSLESKETGTPQIADGNVYVPDSKNTIWALDAATGATRWKYMFPAPVQWVAGGGYLYAAYGTAAVAIKASGQ